ncbi:MAG: hypothetical protein A3B74_05070 [Candidatus Kerfeldbacteria bacterium RIFCSPHIGHO2_02_FULL_42_14]|uniref:Haloacid dehalogenase n=1 Tax=Candidatus Kerfeldbacteria bacterium RIFCSPHIGHO2_02_FULL_42_14 TaxID=1798540 RepID=A0A1G2ASV8_9BACT|nr:MAG: hypothetical protein A3B74_05070 [Candidatus Kerfeldbacteria bacterium RIFCSPHIGHO2_02_FULL_42_14]OGY81380.1 MAG: hypothetical protein A3E60_01670 [Candidatus Kerfeldbacteria bacterium RIFCSPHIGHO2_12_FULL_42_13]OGY83232.1 MAG: hypothetical protein A3I91_03590 [Candidatus Kerfeldbacteria bacterium RIFCSPLOWO2_02_FULL_42_19]
MTKYLITDVDGVVFDRMPLYTRNFSDLVAVFGISTEAAQRYYLHTSGAPITQQFEEVLKKHKISFSTQQLQTLVHDFFHLANGAEAPLFPGVRETFCKIQKAGCLIFATSGSRTPDLEVLFRGYEIPCDLIIGSDEIPKGDQHIQRFAEFVDIPLPEFCRAAAYIGDGPHDMVIATRNKILAIGISNTVDHTHLRASGADVVIANIENLLELLEI